MAFLTSARPKTVARRFALPGLLALFFFSFHLPYLPASLEDLDSINFALGIRHFNVAEHQPHPPGYPLFIFLAKAANAVTGNEVVALGALSITAATLGVLAIASLFRRLDPDGPDAWWVAATALATATPLYWFSAARPLSDAAGLAAVLAVQALTLSAPIGGGLIAAAFGAGLAAGIRSQAVWLTVPLLIFHHGGRRRRGGQTLTPAESVSALPNVNNRSRSVYASSVSNVMETPGDSTSASPASSVVNASCTGAGAPPPASQRGCRVGDPAPARTDAGRRRLPLLAAYTGGVLVWAVPLVGLSGGPAAYLRALSRQGTEDLSGVRMLATSPHVSTLVNALYYAFVAPWATWPIATAVLLLAAAGAVAVARTNTRAAALLAVGFGPYLIFHLLFQETFTGRYALPLVVPVAYCAAAGARLLPRRSGLIVIALVAMLCAHAGGISVAAYSRHNAPAFRLLDDMRAASASLKAPPVLALDRREEFDLRRPIRWVGASMPPLDRKLPAPPQHEWLELVKYWNGGGRAPVWLVVDPMRNAVDLIGRGADAADPARYRWPIPYPVLLSGVRPNEMDWYQIERPDWYVGEGWALTPEAAGVAEADRRGLSSGLIDAWIAPDALAGTLVIGGRNFDAAHPRLEVYVDDRLRDQAVVAPGFFLRFVRLESPPDGRADFVKVTLRTTPPSRTAIEQFDASSRRAVFGYGEGWQEPEFNPRNGLRWRWLSERGELRVRAPAGASRLTLHLEGESPRKYFSRGSRLVVRAGEQPVFDQVLSADFSIDAAVAMPPGSDRDTTMTLETNQVFVPAERSWRPSHDRRHLGLRIFRCFVRVS